MLIDLNSVIVRNYKSTVNWAVKYDLQQLLILLFLSLLLQMLSAAVQTIFNRKYFIGTEFYS